MSDADATPGGTPVPTPEEAQSQLDAALGRFKPREPDADTTVVSENGRAGLRWSPVTEAEPAAGETPAPRPRSSFQFDLGSALARLGGAVEPQAPRDASPADISTDRSSDVVPPADPLPVRGRQPDAETPLPARTPPDGAVEPPPPADPLPVRARQTDPPPEPLPTRTPPSGSSDADARPVIDRLPTRSPRVASAPPVAPTDPTAIDTAPPGESTASSPTSHARSVFDQANPMPVLPATATPRTRPEADRATASAPPAGASPFLPTLPMSMPAAPSVIAPIESAPSTPQLNALRSAQLRANRNDRQGKLLTRSLLGLVLVGGLVGAALVFGRSYLFPTAWDPELTPIVDEIQRIEGVEFDEAVPLVERPPTEYAPLVTAHVLGTDWGARLPEWRALGLAGGDGAVADVQERVANLYPAFFDADGSQIVASAERTVEARRPALRLALELALAGQIAPGAGESRPFGLTGLDPIDAVARRAVDAAAVQLLASAPDAVADLGGTPLPVAYQLRSIGDIGEALLDDAARPGAPLPASAARLDDEAVLAPGGLLQPGDQPVLDPVALGADDWALIWGSRLSPAIAGGMADSLRADSYTVVSRSGATCFVAVLQTDAADAAALLANLGTWVASAPVGAQAAASQLGPDRMQLQACDPGADATVVPALSAVDVVIARQLERVAAG